MEKIMIALEDLKVSINKMALLSGADTLCLTCDQAMPCKRELDADEQVCDSCRGADLSYHREMEQNFRTFYGQA